MIQSLFEINVLDFAEILIQQETLFKRVFYEHAQWDDLSEKDKASLKQVFDEEKKNDPRFSTMSLEEFIQEYNRERNQTNGVSCEVNTNLFHDEDADCMLLNSNSKQPIFDPRTGNYKTNIPIARPPLSRGRPTEFNAYNFIMESESKQMGIPLDLKFETEEDFFEELEVDDECETFQETLNMNEYVDNNLRYIATIVTILNSKKNGYPVLELCGETHLHIT